MTPVQLSSLLDELLSLPHEAEWVEWKHNDADPETIAKNLSGLANAGALHGRAMAYLGWGIENGSKKIVGTSFAPRQQKKGNEELLNWLQRSLHPQVHFEVHEWVREDKQNGPG